MKYQFDVYWEDKKTATIIVSSDRKSVEYFRYTNEVPKVPFLFDNPTVEQVYLFLQGRCMDRRRECVKEYLSDLSLPEYNPWEIVKTTHGAMFEDSMWLMFPGEDLKWEDVDVRRSLV